MGENRQQDLIWVSRPRDIFSKEKTLIWDLKNKKNDWKIKEKKPADLNIDLEKKWNICVRQTIVIHLLLNVTSIARPRDKIVLKKSKHIFQNNLTETCKILKYFENPFKTLFTC